MSAYPRTAEVAIGATRARAIHRDTARAGVATVLRHATSAADAGLLLDVLGLTEVAHDMRKEAP